MLVGCGIIRDQRLQVFNPFACNRCRFLTRFEDVGCRRTSVVTTRRSGVTDESRPLDKAQSTNKGKATVIPYFKVGSSSTRLR